MNKLFLSTAFLALTAAGASAADLYTAPPAEAVVYDAAPAFSWTGFYLGAHGGYGWSDSSADYGDDAINDTCGPTAAIGCALGLDPEGAFVGGQIGFNWQWGQLVLGVEGDYSFASLGDDGEGPTFFGLSETHVDLDVDELATVQARLGWAWGQWLPFATIGWGWAHAERSAVGEFLPPGGVSDDQWHNGLTLGAGLEYAITNHWTVKGEYRWFNGSEETYGDTFGGTEVDLDIHTVRFGVNYKF